MAQLHRIGFIPKIYRYNTSYIIKYKPTYMRSQRSILKDVRLTNPRHANPKPQVCAAVKRVYVPESLHDELVAQLVGMAKAIRVGDGKEESTQLGPIQNEMQLNIVSKMVEEARANGAKVVIGGKRMNSKGYCYEPTIVTDVDESFRLVAEEQFGPVLPVIRYKSVDDAVFRANNTKFGLSASVWGSDVDAAAAVAAQLHAGTVWVNQHLNLSPDLPFGGVKWSGIGREGGKWGMMAYVETRTINISKM
jgi:acyl-CoA reductase-like NAD-dependent aldehyde dehydrogenase